ncbi:GTPase ObgE [Akkermansiaceae bacterium]|nr:GTPase ObgE [Akkermansiaceae bacterium]MDA7876666.1 GTPase ObgE [Akkermansiaceae bacterium]MDB0055486.1 GTPase ObgE [Akkermansiaceae bacterium]MDB4274358.1 GTPase ObgE [Akkermansiaceae bacterium]MDB4275902.1 GTPase ObgE [Akkermansiaceae bacterium]
MKGDKSFVDHIRIRCKSGDGGNGSVSFRREKFVPRGGPDGGDGGDGGKVILIVDENTDNLRSFHYDPKLIAENGAQGQTYKRHGKNGKTAIGRVPPGTVIYRSPAITVTDAVAMERSEDGIDLQPVIDLTEHGQEIVLLEGGKGGRGNFHFRTATNQVPQEREMGTDGSEGIYYLELRRIADAGLVGFPNAGKSTLLGKLSAKKPKVASYPFTTLTPQIGVVPLGGHVRCTVADIPGLIEGAHENRGLGHEFLRHITRCRVLLFVVDMAGSEGRDPIEDIQTLRTEIKMYDEDLAKFPWMVVANKMDLDGAEENLGYFKARFPKVQVVPISAEMEEGLDAVKATLEEIMEKQENA